uniref:Ovule protein n=1 Tax=Heterorhabditis bacteriophora TaxID=37862 RepID=A0A1I7WZW0_HETBA
MTLLLSLITRFHPIEESEKNEANRMIFKSIVNVIGEKDIFITISHIVRMSKVGRLVIHLKCTRMVKNHTKLSVQLFIVTWFSFRLLDFKTSLWPHKNGFIPKSTHHITSRIPP